MFPVETIKRFDEFLVSKELDLDAIVIGGTALALLGFISRQTKDCDILHPSLGEAILDAAKSFALKTRAEGELLDDDWLNNGPSSLKKALPTNWKDNLQIAYQGKALTLHSLGRKELLMSKVFALCDRGIDLNDCIALTPSERELNEITPWVEEQDSNPGWPEHVRSTVNDLKGRL